MAYRFISKRNLAIRLIAENIVNLLMIVSVILYWNFYWDLIDYNILNDQKKPYFLNTFLIGHFSSFALAVCLKTTSLLAGPGTKILDGQIKEGSEAFFDINYLSAIFKVLFVQEY